MESPEYPFDASQVITSARATIARDSAAVAAVADQLGESFADVVAVLLSCGGKVLVTGMGTSGATARRMAHLLSCGGTPSIFVHAADGLHGGLGAVAPRDVLIAISKGGESGELNEFVTRAKERGATTIAMTEVPDSSLARLADRALVITTPSGSDPFGMLAMGSSLAACAVGDALAVELMRLREYAQASFEHTHPGGAVGRLIEKKQRNQDTM